MRHLKNCPGQGVYIYFMMLLDLTNGVFGFSSQLIRELDDKSQNKQLQHNRLKRSWVWNQFFVLEEYTGTEPLYVGKVRHSK